MFLLGPLGTPTQTTESQTKEKQNPFFISVGDPGTTLQFPPSTLLSRLFLGLASVHLRLGPLQGPLHGCLRSRGPALPDLGAAEELMWHFLGWPEPGGTAPSEAEEAFRGLGWVGRVPEGLTCRSRS